MSHITIRDPIIGWKLGSNDLHWMQKTFQEGAKCFRETQMEDINRLINSTVPLFKKRRGVDIISKTRHLPYMMVTVVSAALRFDA